MRSYVIPTSISIAASLFLLAACAVDGERDRPTHDAAELAVYERHAGASEPWVRYTSIRNWWPAGHYAVVFELDRNRHYLANLSGNCVMNIRHAATLRLHTAQDRLIRRSDRVVIGNNECRINSLRRVDIAAVRAETGGDDNPAGGPVEVQEARNDQGFLSLPGHLAVGAAGIQLHPGP